MICRVCQSDTNPFRVRYVNKKGQEVLNKQCIPCHLLANRINKAQSFRPVKLSA